MTKAKEHFNDTADRYEDQIEKIMPYADLFFGITLDCIPGGRTSVLELGSGTGYVTERILRRNPQARITCIDMTPEMLAIARGKPELEGVSFIEGDFREVWPEEQFDLVVTTLCLHHLPDADRARVIHRISTTLNEGGYFINGDIFRPESEWEERISRNRWRRYMVEHGLPAGDAEGMIETRQENFRYIDTLRGYRQKLSDAGFQRILCPYVCYFTSVFLAGR
jgi:tRNA (cmo5U34)-methyltransferase